MQDGCLLTGKVPPVRLAVLDVGSNTVHLVVVDGQPDGTFVPFAGERGLVANVARYHRKALPSDGHPDYMALDDRDRMLVRRLAALLRLADGLDADHFQVVEAATVVDRGDHARLELRARDTPDLAMWAAEGNGDLFELEFGRRVQPVAVEVTQPAGRSLAGRRAGVATAVHVRRRGR